MAQLCKRFWTSYTQNQVKLRLPRERAASKTYVVLILVIRRDASSLGMSHQNMPNATFFPYRDEHDFDHFASPQQSPARFSPEFGPELFAYRQYQCFCALAALPDLIFALWAHHLMSNFGKKSSKSGRNGVCLRAKSKHSMPSSRIPTHQQSTTIIDKYSGCVAGPASWSLCPVSWKGDEHAISLPTLALQYDNYS